MPTPGAGRPARAQRPARPGAAAPGRSPTKVRWSPVWHAKREGGAIKASARPLREGRIPGSRFRAAKNPRGRRSPADATLPTRQAPKSLPPRAKRTGAATPKARNRPTSLARPPKTPARPPHADGGDGDGPSTASMLTGGTAAAVAGLVVLAGTAVAAREPLQAFVDYFIGVVDDLGPAG